MKFHSPLSDLGHFTNKLVQAINCELSEQVTQMLLLQIEISHIEFIKNTKIKWTKEMK